MDKLNLKRLQCTVHYLNYLIETDQSAWVHTWHTEHLLYADLSSTELFSMPVDAEL